MPDAPPFDRPWPRPAQPWRMVMRWHDLLFAHWPFDPKDVAPKIPAGLELDTFDGKAWIGVIPFRMSGVRARGLPGVPWLSGFPEINVRTYVTRDGKPGVWFFSLDAARLAAVKVARATFHLPYFHARMRCERKADGWVEYESERIDQAGPPAGFRARYRGVGRTYFARKGTLEYFLTARYCLYAQRGDGVLLRGEIDHAPWPLRRAEWDAASESMITTQGFARPTVAPELHFASELDVAAWAPSEMG